MKKSKVKLTFICISCSDTIKDFWNPKWGWNRRVMPEFGESKDRYLCYECYKKYREILVMNNIFKSPVPKSILKQSNVGKSFFIDDRWFILESMKLTSVLQAPPLKLEQLSFPREFGPIDTSYEWNFFSPYDGISSCTLDIFTDKKKNITSYHRNYSSL